MITCPSLQEHAEYDASGPVSFDATCCEYNIFCFCSYSFANNPGCSHANVADNPFDSPGNQGLFPSFGAAIFFSWHADTPYDHNRFDFYIWGWLEQDACNGHNEWMISWLPPRKPIRSRHAFSWKENEKKIYFFTKKGKVDKKRRWWYL